MPEPGCVKCGGWGWNLKACFKPALLPLAFRRLWIREGYHSPVTSVRSVGVVCKKNSEKTKPYMIKVCQLCQSPQPPNGLIKFISTVYNVLLLQVTQNKGSGPYTFEYRTQCEVKVRQVYIYHLSYVQIYMHHLSLLPVRINKLCRVHLWSNFLASHL